MAKKEKILQSHISYHSALGTIRTRLMERYMRDIRISSDSHKVHREILMKGGIMQVMQGFAQEAKKVVQAMIVLYSAEVI